MWNVPGLTSRPPRASGLLAVLLLAGAGCRTGPAPGPPSTPGTAPRPSSVPPALRPLVVTERVVHDTDDPAIWFHPQDRSRSLVVGTDKNADGGLYAFDLDGSIYTIEDGTGYILVSDQQANQFHVFPREGSGGNPHSHPRLKTVRVSTIESDGSEVTNARLGPRFPEGLFVAMSEGGVFHYYAWPDLARPELAVAPDGTRLAMLDF